MTETLTTYEVEDKGLKSGALGFISSTAIGVASTAPAYSLAATLGFVVALVGVQAPLFVLLAFIPMFMAAWAIKNINAVDPDCGTSFTWAWRAIGPRTGWWAGGWGTIASDFLAMASQSQIAGQYFFLLIGATSIGSNAASVWVLLMGVLWIVVLTWMCYVGIQVSARTQVVLVTIEVIVLILLAVVALVKVANGSAPIGHIDPSWSWFSPVHIRSFSTLMQGMLLMVFIYWGWDTTTSVNEETKEPGRIPGIAGVISTFILLGTYLLVVLSVQSYAGIGTHGIGLANPNHVNDVLSVMGNSVFGTGTLGKILTKLLFFMILSSSAATTQTTILPNARTTLSMAFHKAVPEIFGRIHPRYKTPTFSTLAFSALSIVFYVGINFLSGGNVISDSVTAATFFVSVYLGISAAACAWHFRGTVHAGFRTFFSNVVVAALATVILFGLLIYNVILYGHADQSYVDVNLPLLGSVGTTELIGVATGLLGFAAMFYCRFTKPQFFRDRSMRYGPSLTETGEVVPQDESEFGPI
jgi:amino acid transporter